MGYVTKGQIDRARETHVLEYVLSYEKSDYKRVGNGYRHKDDDALAVSERGWYCHKREIGNVTALDYLVKIRGYDFVSAVCHLINEAHYDIGDKPQGCNKTPPQKASSGKIAKATYHIQKRQNLILPRRDKDNYKIIAYLHNRGIDRGLILDCINSGILYQSAIHKNAVFLGKDEHGKTQFAAMRSTIGNFKCDATGSDKKYGFILPPNEPNSPKIAVFESAIDSMSHFTLCKRGNIPDYNGWRLSLGGTCIVTLHHFLERHPEINHCVICTDNDEAGNNVAEKIAKELSIKTERSPHMQGKDWNDTLKIVLQAELKKLAQQKDIPYL